MNLTDVKVLILIDPVFKERFAEHAAAAAGDDEAFRAFKDTYFADDPETLAILDANRDAFRTEAAATRVVLTGTVGCPTKGFYDDDESSSTYQLPPEVDEC